MFGFRGYVLLVIAGEYQVFFEKSQPESQPTDFYSS
jgi:hypothetical protein